MTYQLNTIGKVKNDGNGTFIQLEPEYIPGLRALDGFGHINVLWWFSKCDNEADRHELQTRQPYNGAPEIMGVFATRSPARPNPIAMTASEVINMILPAASFASHSLTQTTIRPCSTSSHIRRALTAWKRPVFPCGAADGRKARRHRAISIGGRYSTSKISL